jgi:ABC-type multidrug transport system ATPase subunit
MSISLKHALVLTQLQLRLTYRNPLSVLARVLLPAAILLVVRYTLLGQTDIGASNNIFSALDGGNSSALSSWTLAESAHWPLKRSECAKAVPGVPCYTVAYGPSSDPQLTAFVTEFGSRFDPPLKMGVDILNMSQYYNPSTRNSQGNDSVFGVLQDNAMDVQVVFTKYPQFCANQKDVDKSRRLGMPCPAAVSVQVRGPTVDGFRAVVHPPASPAWPLLREAQRAALRLSGFNDSASRLHFNFVDRLMPYFTNTETLEDEYNQMRTTTTTVANTMMAGNATGGIPYNPVDWIDLLAIVYPVLFVIAFFPFQLAAHSKATQERRKKLDVSLRVAGVSFGAITFARVAAESVVALISVPIFVLTGFFTNVPLFAAAPGLCAAMAILCALNMTAYGFAIAQLVARVEVASALLFFILLVTVLLSGIFWLPDVADIFFGPALSWWSTCGFAQNMSTILIGAFRLIAAEGESSGRAVFPAGALDSLAGTSPFTFGAHIAFMVMDVVLAWIYTLWVGVVSPGELGIPKPVCFLCNPFYWFNSLRRRRLNSTSVDIAALAHGGDENSVVESLDPDILSEVRGAGNTLMSGRPAPLVLVKLTKLYKKGRILSRQDVRAVDGVTLVGEQSTCVALLGHNGAGKTSIVQMITGMLSPSFGDAFVCGRSLTADSEAAGAHVGLCPQENILWPLTCAENLRLYARLKWPLRHKRAVVARVDDNERRDHDDDDDPIGAAMRADTIEAEVNRCLDIVGLSDRRDAYAHELSGGMQRRLAFALALVGDPPIIVLDEPTCGLDPRTRRSIWTVIEQLRKDHLVILCTHDMLEAEQLADKVALLALGQLRAVGHVLHLKKRSGVGYRVSMAVADVEQVRAQLRNDLPTLETSATLRSAALSMVFTFSAAAIADLLALLSLLEAGVPGVVSFSLSQCTMEDLFMRLTHGHAEVAASGSTSFVLTYARASDEAVLGSIELQRRDTLSMLRVRMQERFPGARLAFHSPSGGLVLEADEPKMYALDLLPCAVVSFLDEPLPTATNHAATTVAAAARSSQTNASASSSSSTTMVVELRGQLAAEQKQVAEQRERIDVLENEIARLRKLLEEKEKPSVVDNDDDENESETFSSATQ